MFSSSVLLRAISSVTIREREKELVTGGYCHRLRLHEYSVRLQKDKVAATDVDSADFAYTAPINRSKYTNPKMYLYT